MGADFDVHVVDLPGHGTVPAASDYRYDALVEHVRVQTAELGRFMLMGHSVGAAVAWLYAARHPGRVTRLVLLEPAAPHQSAFRHGPTPQPKHPYTFASLDDVKQMLTGFDPSATGDDIRHEYRQRPDGRWEPDFDPAIFPALVDDQRDRGEAFLAELAQVTVPVLIVRAARGFLGPEQIQEIAAGLHDVQVAEIAEAGHPVQRDQPERLAALVGAFARA